MRIFISTGEVSGDLQGAMLTKALYTQAQAENIDLEIVGLGGKKMVKAGCTLLEDTSSIGSVGIFESLPFVLPTWLIQRRAKQYLQTSPPDILVLIDYLSPNLGIGRYVHQYLPHVPIIYYIGPQNWIWHSSEAKMSQLLKLNVTKLVTITDHLLAIFQGEAQYFKAQGMSVTWVGHPLLDTMQNVPTKQAARELLGLSAETIVIALFPASRPQEIKYLLPVICEAAQQLQKQLTNVHFLLPLSLSNYRSPIEEIINKYHLSVTILEGNNLEAIASADLAITKSGTVNLEIALLNVPQVVIYRVNPVSMWLARHFLKFSIPFMSPVNLVLMQDIVPELLQEAATPERIVQESLELLLNQQRKKKILLDYQNMRSHLGEIGVCKRVAQEIIARASKI